MMENTDIKKNSLNHPIAIEVEELANALTHGFGLILSILGLSWLWLKVQPSGDPWKMGCALLFGSSLIVLYAASTFYHSFQELSLKRRLRIFDHCAIYTLIAGSYTPFALITLYDSWGGWLFGIEWSLAAVGIVFKLFFTERFNLLSTLFYLAMGWLVVISFQPLMAGLEPAGLALLVAGGLLYTLGAVIYIVEKPRFHHAIWHMFVIGGSTCHYFSILHYVL
jgi:hemolysin III